MFILKLTQMYRLFNLAEEVYCYIEMHSVNYLILFT